METRIIIIALLTAAVVGLALATRRWQRPAHRPIDLSGHDFPEGFLIFTSTECSNCKQALAVLEQSGAPIREVTWELEPQVIEGLGVESVPLVLRVDDEGRPIAQLAGVPSRRWLRRSAGATG